MRLFGRRTRPGTARQADGADTAHLVAFARSHAGVEAFVEPPTAVTATTVMLVAGSGEWTRRRVRDAAAAHELANRLGVPSYDAAVVGYPKRMREWNAARRGTDGTPRGEPGAST
ncbi:MAG TPA: hypothetical protein VGO19_10425 [Actinomycetes bacterium]